MKKNPLLIIIGVVVVLGMIATCIGCFVARQLSIRNIDSYAKCIKQYLVQTLIYPPRCTTPNGKTFVDPTATIPVEPTGTIGIANPASVYCEDQGGTLNMVIEEGGGMVGMCTLKGGKICEEWAYFRGECK